MYIKIKSKKLFKSFGVFLMATVLLLGCIYPMLNSANASNVGKQTLKVAVLSDTHYIPSSMVNTKNTEFKKAVNEEIKMFAESGSIIDSAFNRILQDKPEVLLITGDLTKDGEKESHKSMANKLNQLQAKLKAENVNTKIYLINGNHDINNSDAMVYSRISTKSAEKTSASDFRMIYKNFCYNNDVIQYSTSNQEKAGSLSYVARPKDGFTIIAVDDCKYSTDSTSNNKAEHETEGNVSSDLMKWILKQTETAKKRGDQVIVIQHHGVVPHCESEPVFMSEYMVDNYKEVGTAYANAGIKYVLTGHMHANDIAQLSNTDYGKGCELTDIETGSAITYPSPMRNIVFTNDKTNKTESADISTTYINNINYKDKNGKLITDLQAYGKNYCMSSDTISIIASNSVSDTIEEIKAFGGTEKYADKLGSKLLKNDNVVIKDYLVSLLPQLLPTSADNALDINITSTLKAKVYYDTSRGCIRLIGVMTTTSGLQMFDLSITDTAIKATVSDVFSQADKTIINNPAQIYNLIDKVSKAIMDMTVYEKDGVKKTVYDLVNEIYLSHLAGIDSNPPIWVLETLNDPDGLTDKLISTVVKTSYPDIIKILNNFHVDLSQLVSKTNQNSINEKSMNLMNELINSDSTLKNKFGMQVNAQNYKNIISDSNSTAINSLIYIFGKRVPLGIVVNRVMSEDKVIASVPDSTKSKLSDAIYQIGYTVANDSNCTEDNYTVIKSNKIEF